MRKRQRTWQQFEDLVKRILEKNNFTIKRNSQRGATGFDFIGTYNQQLWAIEVKYYRTARVRPSLIKSAAARVVNNGIGGATDKGMLVTSNQLTGTLRHSLEQEFNISFVDRVDLRSFAACDPLLLDELDALLELEPEYIENEYSMSKFLSAPFDTKKHLSDSKKNKLDTRGTDLCKELKSLRKGKGTWSEYEKLCERILRYLFPNDLEGWYKQKSTDDGVNRYDFVCRVRPTTEFWQFLVEHLNSRYIVFEFKNYSNKIKQGQVLTTEKYLMERALRRAAIVLSRCGADKNANKMMQGAMREHGKLILSINDNQVCDMLHKKEQGEDPTDFLFDITDDFLLSLPR